MTRINLWIRLFTALSEKNVMSKAISHAFETATVSASFMPPATNNSKHHVASQPWN